MKLIVIFDDTVRKSEVIEDVIGEKGFSEVVVKRQRLGERFRQQLLAYFPEMEWQVVRSVFAFNALLEQFGDQTAEPVHILHMFANYIISDAEWAKLSFQKLPYIAENYRMTVRDETAGLMFADTKSYRTFLERVCKEGSSAIAARTVSNSFPADGLVNIGDVFNFIRCITGNFDARYFNSLEEKEYTLTKRSTNKKKIKAEYTFYHLLPDDMKRWFVLPFNYQEDEKSASYTMERLYMTDLAIKWVHGSIGEEEFRRLLDMYFNFFRERHAKPVSEEEYRQTSDALYIGKVESRIEELKQLESYGRIAALLQSGTGETIDDIKLRYFSLKERLEASVNFSKVSVIGHGDPCFANAMYNKATRMLKFIDPKGALTEEELWTNPYYDLAKLSHSVCGSYDFFNNGLYEIGINTAFRAELKIGFDNTLYKKIFREKAEAAGYNYLLIRLYEASLFLSMLPLHIDNPHKVFGFILNARNILEEIQHELQ